MSCHTTAGRMQLLPDTAVPFPDSIRSAVVWLTAFCSSGALMIERTVLYTSKYNTEICEVT
jgi:hypothetical protein